MKNRLVALIACVTLLLATATVFADTFKPKIYQVYVDDNGVMTILGTGFPEGGYVQTLKVGGIPATDIVYDGVADSVQAQVPAQLGPGDYRLLVNFKLNNNAKNVIWDLSIGAQGPQGEQGEQGKLGEAGDQGVQGKLGPPGNDGAQGAQGKLGPQGVQGKMGPPGLGDQGQQGKLGPQGEQGKIGPQGQDGTSCSLGECSVAGEATLTCGATSVVTPCTIDLNRVIGVITADITRTPNSAGESALGDIVADAQLEATAPAGFGEAVVSFVNPGIIRDDLLFLAGPAMEGDGNVTLAEALSVQPFGNSLVTMTLTGAQIDTLLEQQWVGQTLPRILQVSDGFSYQWDAAAPDGSKVDPASVVISGASLNVAASYRVTVNSFLADGGDNFSVLVDGTDRLVGEIDVDALVTYFGLNSPVAPGPQDRITRLN